MFSLVFSLGGKFLDLENEQERQKYMKIKQNFNDWFLTVMILYSD